MMGTNAFVRLLATLTVISFGTGVAAAAPDLSSPKATVKSLYESIERGDEEAIRMTLLAESADQRGLGEAYARLMVAGKQFADAAKKRYGSAADALAQGAVMLDEIERLESATVKETGDTATLAGSRQPGTARRTGPHGRSHAHLAAAGATRRSPGQ
jgi:hypothetical protein